MAYVAEQIPENEKNQFAKKDQTTPIPPQTGGSAGAGGQSGNAAPGVGTSTQFGSNAAKLSDYLNANKDQAAGFGQQVAGDLTNRYNQTLGNIDKGFGAFGQQVNQGFSQPDQAKVDQAASNPAAFAQDPNNVSQFQGWFNNQYKGPNSAEESGFYGDLNNQVNQAVQNSQLTGNSAGLGTYLNNFMGANDTTEGMRTLDTALLQGNKESAKAIKDASSQYGNLNGYLSGQTKQADTNIGAVKQQADASRQDIQNRFVGQNGVIPTFENDLNQRLSQARSGATTKADQTMAGLLRGGTATPNPDLQSLLDLGFDPGTAPSVQGAIESLSTDYGQAFNPNLVTRNDPNAAFNLGNVASSDDYARAAALSQLTGQDLSGFLNPANSAQAGTAPKSLLNVDQNAFKDATTGALRQNDQNALQDIVSRAIPSKVDINQYLSDPNNVASLRSKLSGTDLATFDKVVARLGYSASNGSGPTTTTGAYTTEPIPSGSGVMRAS